VLTAHDLFLAIGMEAFAERAGRELVATGEKAMPPRRQSCWCCGMRSPCCAARSVG
jgi:hypothetical protein